MTWTGDPIWLPDVLRDEGVQVVEYPGWRWRGHGDFREVWGVMAHHTGASGSPGPRPIAEGVAGLAGPLSQIHLSRTGVATVVAAGVAWHAGAGDYPGLPTNDGNWHLIGIEAENNGTEGWSDPQYDAYVRCCAAICRRLGVRADRVIGHKEWAGAAQGKWDPGQMDMDAFRADIQARLDTGGDGMSENRLVEEIWQQLRGPAGSGWPQLGQTLEGHDRTLVDGVAAALERLAVLTNDLAVLREDIHELRRLLDPIDEEAQP